VQGTWLAQGAREEVEMKVQDAMTRNVAACNQDDILNYAAQLMWDYDCGAVPVLDGLGIVSGIVTDRDICMAAYTKGLPLTQILVRDAMSRVVHTANPEDTVESALALMRRGRVRRIPVTDGGRVVGMLSLSDLMRVLRSSRRDAPQAESIVETLVLISEPRTPGRMNDDGRGARDVSRGAESRTH
jgi:CBS domain-containing protein